MAPWIALALGLSAAASSGISIGPEAIAFEAETAPPVCWVAPRRLRKKDRARLEQAVVRAGQATMPGHVRYRIESIRSSKRTKLDCQGFVFVGLRGPRKRTRVTIRARRPDESKSQRVARFYVKRDKLERKHFESAWRDIWDRIGPPPPPAPATDPAPPPPVAVTPFVDQELAAESAVARPAPPPPKLWAPPRVSFALQGGWSTRNIEDAPGAAQSSAQVASAGGRIVVHGARWLNLAPEHDVDLTVTYWHRFIDGQQGDTAVSVSADRTAATVRYRLVLAEGTPRFGPLLGYEFSRFESDADAALSTRFSVLRVGVDAAQPILRLEPGTGLWLEAASALRWSPTGDAGLGFDVQVEAAFRLRLGLFVSLGARFTRQSGEAASAAFIDQTVDAFAAVGWSL